MRVRIGPKVLQIENKMGQSRDLLEIRFQYILDPNLKKSTDLFHFDVNF